MNYSDQLRSPRWQMKRLKILERDNATCQICHDTETELHIHHKKYVFGKKAWEAEDINLQTLCKFCHAFITLFSKENKDYEIIDVDFVWFYMDRHPLFSENRLLYTVLCKHKQASEYFIIQCFYDTDTNSITNMPLIPQIVLDKFFKHLPKNGNF